MQSMLQVLPRPLSNVRKLSSIDIVFDRIVLWGIVNNAGVNFKADVELTPMKYFELVNDINYLGMVRVTKQFLPLIRQSKGTHRACGDRSMLQTVRHA